MSIEKPEMPEMEPEEVVPPKEGMLLKLQETLDGKREYPPVEKDRNVLERLWETISKNKPQ